MTTEKSRTIEIPESLYARVDAIIKGTRFASVSAYIVQMLRERLAKEQNEQASSYTKEEEERIKDRLRALGYL